jgi:hypothetical protein
MDGCHLDVVAEVWEVLESDCLVLVITNNIFHHELWRKRLGVGQVARKIKSWSTVVGSICDVDSVGAARSIQMISFEFKG